MRLIIWSVATLLTFACSTATQSTSKNLKKNIPVDEVLFKHGVASGDPMSDAVIIWTRLSTDQKTATVKWEMSESPDFSSPVLSGLKSTDQSVDYTVKVDVMSLKANTVYYYRFITEGKSSPTGKTKTLAVGKTDHVKLGVVSCSNYEFGYFNAYNGMAAADLDAILHLGDYIYEYGPDKYGDKSFSRKHLPAKEITTLQDYRTRYAQYREDKGLKNAHASHPFIMIWDDHEIANNAYKDGAQNHQEDEGDFNIRKQIAKKAYYEWQPIRESSNDELYRSFAFGDLLELIMLDERYTGRHEPPASIDEAAVERTMLGAEQLTWFKEQLQSTNATWKVIGNQVIFSPCDLSLVRPDDAMNLDAWDGYSYERDDIRSFLKSAGISNTIFVTGDTHSSWAFEVPALDTDYKDNGKTCAIEIGTPSITSGNWNDGNTTDDQVKLAEGALKMSNPHLKFVNGRDHGYVILDISTTGATAQWYYTKDIKQLVAPIYKAHEMSIQLDTEKFGK